MSESQGDTDYLLLQDPNLAPEELQRIASTRPDLDQQVLQHPNVYPELTAWIIQNQQVRATQPGMLPQAATKSPGKKGRVILLSSLAALLVLGGLGFGAWWWFGQDSNSSTSFSAVPQQVKVVDLRTLGDSVSVVPIGVNDPVALETSDLRLIGLESDGEFFLAGIDMHAHSGLPQWIVPTEDPSSAYVDGDWYFAGDTTYHLSVEGALPAERPADAPKPPSAGSSEGDGAAGSGDSNAAPTKSVTAKLSGTATEDVPFAADSDNRDILNQAGETLAKFQDPSASVFALVPQGKSPWIFSNGNQVFAVQDSRVLWDLTLPQGSLEVNGFDSPTGPTWDLSGNILLLGTPSAVLALDTKTGEEVWKLDTPVESWTVDQDTLVIVDGDNLSLHTFKQGDNAKAESEEDFDQGADDSPSDAAGTVPPPLSAEELMGATLELPTACASLAGTSTPAVFEEGNADGQHGWVEMTGSAEVLNAGTIDTAVAFACHGETSTQAAVGVYTQDLVLLAAPDLGADLAWVPGPEHADVRAQGSALRVLASGDSSAEVTYVLGDDELVPTRLADPDPNWADTGNGMAIKAGVREPEPEALSSYGRLVPEDLANITIFAPTVPGNPETSWETVTFTNYRAVLSPAGGDTPWESSLEFISRETVGANIAGQPFLATSLFSGSMHFVGSMCLISEELDVLCATFPPNMTAGGDVWAENIQVDGDVISYELANGTGSGTMYVKQRYDGARFSLVSAHY